MVSGLAAIGQPIDVMLGTRFERLMVQAGVRRIKPHGWRHTAATLLLRGGVLSHVVAARLRRARGDL